MDNKKNYIKAITTIRDEFSNLLSASDLDRLEAELDKLRKAFPNDDDFIDEGLDFLEEAFPAVYQAIQDKIGDTVGPERIQPLPGAPIHLPPGTLLVCQTCGYEYELPNIGEWPVFCKNDGKQLYPQSEA